MERHCIISDDVKYQEVRCEHARLAARRNSDHRAADVTTIASLNHRSTEQIRGMEVRWDENRRGLY